MATSKSIIHPFPAQGRASLTITSLQISQYAELAALISQLEAQQKALRKELLTLRSAGAEQGTESPYLLSFVDQERRTVDWETQALSLAERLYGIEQAGVWRETAKQTAPVVTITQIRVKPNPSFAAGLAMSQAGD